MAIPTAYASFHTLESLLLLHISPTALANTWLTFVLKPWFRWEEVAKGIKLECLCTRACNLVCVCVMRINRKPRLCISLKGPHVSCDHRILFSFQKNHLKMTFYTAWICLFMCPQHGHSMRGNIDCWLSRGRGKENGYPQNEKGGGTDVVLVEHKNNGAISVSRCRYLNEHPITRASVSLQRGTRVPN